MKDHRHSWLSFGRGRASAIINARIKAKGHILRKKKSYNGCRQVQGTVCQFIEDIELKMVALSSAIVRIKIREQPSGSSYLISLDYWTRKFIICKNGTGAWEHSGSEDKFNGIVGRLTGESIHQELSLCW
jgi:hypothetical protein